MFFKSYYNDGPGVRKDEPEPVGLARYFRMLFLDFWSFIGLNMLYVLCCLPIVTIGGATLAYNRLCCRLISKKHVFVLSDFKDSFKENFKRGIAISFVLVLVVLDLIILYSNALGYMQGDEMGRQAVIVWAFCCVLATLIISLMQYLIMVIANFEKQPFIVQVQNAVLLMITGGVRTIAMAALDIIVFAVVFTYFPFSGMVMFVGGFYLLFFTNCYLTWPVVLKQVEKQNEEASSEQEAEAGEEDYFEPVDERLFNKDGEEINEEGERLISAEEFENMVK